MPHLHSALLCLWLWCQSSSCPSLAFSFETCSVWSVKEFVAIGWQIGTALQYFQFTLAKARIMKQMKQIYFFITNIFLYNKYILGLLPLPGTWGASWRAEQQTDPLPVLGPVEQMVTTVVFTKPNCKPLLLFRYKYQPLDHIRDYFGEQIAIYFAWLGEFLSLDYNISFRESCYTLVCNNLQLFQL